MKKISLLIMLALFTALLCYAQKEVKKKEPKTSQTYSRNSLTPMLLDYPGYKYNSELKSIFKSYDPGIKYDRNYVSPENLSMPDTLMSDGGGAGFVDKAINKVKKIFKGEQPDVKAKVIYNKLVEQNYHSKLMEDWYDVKNDGTYSTKLIAERGNFNASKADKDAAKMSAMGSSMLADAGLKLIGNSHIALYDFSNLISMKDNYDRIDAKNKETSRKSGGTIAFTPTDRTENGFKGQISVYVYKYMYSDTIDGLFKQSFANDKVDLKKFERLCRETNVNPFKLVYTETVKVEKTQLNTAPDQKPKDVLFSDAVDKAMKKLSLKMANNYDPFRVVAKVRGDEKIEARLGKKEGLLIDQRFTVWRAKYNEKNAKQTFQKRGVVRVKKVADNFNTDATTEFYQVWGISSEMGDILQQNDDLGMGITLGYGLGALGGIYGRFEYNTVPLMDKYLNMPPFINSLKIYGDLHFQTKTYGGEEGDVLPEADYDFLRFHVGLSKDFYFMRNFHATPFIGIGAERGVLEPKEEWEWEYEKVNFNVTSLDMGARVAANLFIQQLQAIASVHFNMPISEVKIEDQDEDPLDFYDSEGNVKKYKWDEFFDGRKGLWFDLGLRFQF